MPRRLFTLAAAASLVLCAATCVLWARSHWIEDGYYFAQPRLGIPFDQFQIRRPHLSPD